MHGVGEHVGHHRPPLDQTKHLIGDSRVGEDHDEAGDDKDN